MKRFLIQFQSHHEGPTDIHFVDVRAYTMMQALRMAQVECPPPHPWVLIRAFPWPRGCRGVEEAALKLTGTGR